MAIQVTGVTTLLQVFDMPRAIDFYCGLLNFIVRDHSPVVETPEGRFFHWAWLELNGSALMLNTAYDAGERPPEPDAARVAAHGDTGLYFLCADVDTVHAHLLAKGLDVAPPISTPYGMRQVSLTDPDGYRLHFQTRM